MATRLWEPVPELSPVGKTMSAFTSKGRAERPKRLVCVPTVSLSVTPWGPPSRRGEAKPIPVPKKPPLVRWGHRA